MVAIVVDPGSFTTVWVEQLKQHLPDDTIVTKHAEIDPDDVEFLVHWKHPTERILSYSNMKALVLASAGFDHISPEVRAKFPVVRLVDPAMAHDIALYCLSWVIHFHRDFDVFAASQGDAHWKKMEQSFPRDFTVGVLGAGQIGSTVLQTIRSQSYQAVGWSRTDHDRSQLQFFSDCDVVINLLPNTPATKGLISTELLAALGSGALINVGRGLTVDTSALLSALDADLRAAVLDVFETEPLPDDHPLWRHPRVTVTPHIAGRTDPFTASAVVAENIKLVRAGESPAGLIT